MPIPTSTHLITVQRPAEPGGWGEGDGPATQLASNVRAVLGEPRGTELGNTESTAILALTCDEVDGMDPDCQVVDQATGLVYDVVWVVRRPSLLGVHMEGGVEYVRGAAIA